MLVYVAAPIDHKHGERAKDLKAEAITQLNGKQFATYDASKPFGRGDCAPEEIVGLHQAALERSAGMLALLPDGCSSVGVPMEILMAHRILNIPVAVVGAQWSVQLRGMEVPTFDPQNGCYQAVEWLEECMKQPQTREEFGRKRLAEARERRVTMHLDGGQLADAVTEHAGEARPICGDPRVVKWTGAPYLEPKRPYPGDAGYDLVCSKDTRIPYNGFADVPCGIKVELPVGTWALLVGRSSTLRRRELMVAQSVIDQEYRGELFAGVWNLGEKGAEVKQGERIAQLIPFAQESRGLVMERVDELERSERGERGFGSTGE